MSFERKRYERIGICFSLLTFALILLPIVLSLVPGSHNWFSTTAWRNLLLLSMIPAIISLAITIKVFRMPKVVENECPKCGYDVGTTSLRCSECGWTRTL